MEQKTYTIRDFYFWRITISLALASSFIFACLYVVQPLLPVFVKDFGVSVSQASLALSLTVVGLVVGLIVLGFLSDRHGRTLFIKLSLIGSVIPFFIVPLSDSFFVLLFFRFVQGFTLAGLPAAAIAYLSEEIDKKSVGVAIALYISSNALGGMIGRVLAGYIADVYSWETTFYFLGVVGVIVLIAVFLMLPKSLFFKSSNLTFSRDIKEFSFHLKSPLLLLVFGLGFILQLSFSGVWTYLPFYLQEPPFSLSLQAISFTFLAYGFGMFGAPIAGWLANHFGLERIRLIGIIILSIGVLMTLSPSILLVVVGLCLVCFGFFTAHSLTATSVSEQATHHKGSASSLYLVTYYLGVAGGSTILGPLWDVSGWIGLALLTGILPVVYFGIMKALSTRIEKKAALGKQTN